MEIIPKIKISDTGSMFKNNWKAELDVGYTTARGYGTTQKEALNDLKERTKEFILILKNINKVKVIRNEENR